MSRVPLLPRWSAEDLERFLVIRQEFFLDPMGSNKDRFFEAVMVLQQALFDWYLRPPGKFEGMLALVSAVAEKWSALRKEERRTMPLRRFGLNNASPDIPAVESSVSEGQWQKIFGSLGFGMGDPGTFDRFLVQLDEETNPSLRVNHRYVGELLPHDNMISYLSSITATFLNENAIIGKVSPCVTHMEQAAVKWLLTLVGWDSDFRISYDENLPPEKRTVPAQRLPTAAPAAQKFLRWEREDPTGTIVAGGTIANISALLIARNAVFDYLLGWSGAASWLGPIRAWEAVADVWGKKRLVIVTSKGAHYSVKKAAVQAGVAPADVVELAGSENPWVLDGPALERALQDPKRFDEGDLIIAVVAIAGKTETGYVDDIANIAEVLNRLRDSNVGLPRLPQVLERLGESYPKIESVIGQLKQPKNAQQAFKSAREEWSGRDLGLIMKRVGNEIANTAHNRLFLHVDAAHGGGFLCVPELRQSAFNGIELADTITIDGHKSFYCYYPCGGLLIRTTRWAQTFSIGHSAYISEDENRNAYREGLVFAKSNKDIKVGEEFDKGTSLKDQEHQRQDEKDLAAFGALQRMLHRPISAERSELTHQPFNQYLEGSRGPQGIMQLYFNLATLGRRGYESLLGWGALVRERCEEAISLGMPDLRLVTDEPLPTNLYATDKTEALLRCKIGRADGEDRAPRVLPTLGGRFLRLSGGACNQLLITYVPAREAKLIATAPREYWNEKDKNDRSGRCARLLRTMRYLWRINEHLWQEHIYANPAFTYYIGHTALELICADAKDRRQGAEKLRDRLTGWNAWTRSEDRSNAFFDVLANAIADGTIPDYTQKFFCHKIVVMHPYTDESLLSDMLRRLAFWGERSIVDVRMADATARFLFPDGKPPGAASKKRKNRRKTPPAPRTRR